MRTQSLLCASTADALRASLGLAQLTQTLPAWFVAVQGAPGCACPFYHTADHSWQRHYANANFAQTGPITITVISVLALSPTVRINAFDFPSVDVWCSEATTQYTVASN